MANCFKCIHEDVCEELKCSRPVDCAFFKDRSKFIELPCKVGKNGDIFWAVESYDISPYQCLGIKYGYDCLEGDNTIMLLAVGGREYIFGKEAFFHKEQAEQALRERRSKNESCIT